MATPLNADDSRTSLLNAARAILVTDGVKGLSVRRVADQAGCTTMAVYSRYGGKEGLLSALFDEGFERLALAQADVSRELAPTERVLALCHAYRQTAQAYPHHYALMLGNFSGDHTPSPESSAKAMSTLTTLASAVATLLTPHQDREQRATAIANSLFAFCHGWVSLERLGFFGDGRQVSQGYEQAVLALLNG
jgi:AcrR family transcriptional regulator